MTAQYVIGIDLGTTNSVLSYRPAGADNVRPAILPIPQCVAPQTVESRSSLPSFMYLATDPEADRKLFALPWSDISTYVAGTAARGLSAEHPMRTISAAKSWLCHSRVDRHQAILPWKSPPDIPQLSPVTVSQCFLEHLIAAWNARFPEAPFSEQDVVLTVPASFDASARELTREAALGAGLPESFVLLEEPQAATYAWLDSVGDRWRKQVRLGDRLLVCDVGGGTTDLTLVEVTEESGELSLRRIAVGNHLLIGGDNMDLSLAWFVSQKFAEKGVQLDPWQSISLWHSCRNAKEALLSLEGPETHTISIPGRSSRLIGGLVSVEVNRQEVSDLICEGFFPFVPLSERPDVSVHPDFRSLACPTKPTPQLRDISPPLSSRTALTNGHANCVQWWCIQVRTASRTTADSDSPVVSSGSSPGHRRINRSRFRGGSWRLLLRLEQISRWSSNSRRHGSIILRRCRNRWSCHSGRSPPAQGSLRRATGDGRRN